ncbi:MAG: response regulator [Chloroflexi bacterium]|nr:response regulator [Chloroflexota bacterium]
MRLALIVDDDRVIREMLCLFLHLTGYETEEANDGVDALNKIQRRQPDIVILDVMMPNMDGIELCKLLRQNAQTAHLPIIMLSGKTQVEAVAEGLQAGANRYLTKPASMDVLTQTMAEVLGESGK